MGHHDLAIAATSQSLMGSRLGAAGAIGSGMSIAGSQSSQAGLHLGSIGATSGGATGDSGGTGSTVSSQFNQQQANGQHKRGIQTSPDGNYLFLFCLNCGKITSKPLEVAQTKANLSSLFIS